MPRSRLLNQELPESGKLSVNRSIKERWGYPEVFNKGFVAIPSLFLEVYAHLKPYPLTTGEAMFVLELMSFKWTKEAPYPSYKRIAERMNVSDKMARRYAQSLELKSYLHRRTRKNNTNLFDLGGLFHALLAVTRDPKILQLPRSTFMNSDLGKGGR